MSWNFLMTLERRRLFFPFIMIDSFQLCFWNLWWTFYFCHIGLFIYHCVLKSFVRFSFVSSKVPFCKELFILLSTNFLYFFSSNSPPPNEDLQSDSSIIPPGLSKSAFQRMKFDPALTSNQIENVGIKTAYIIDDQIYLYMFIYLYFIGRFKYLCNSLWLKIKSDNIVWQNCLSGHLIANHLLILKAKLGILKVLSSDVFPASDVVVHFVVSTGDVKHR